MRLHLRSASIVAPSLPRPLGDGFNVLWACLLRVCWWMGGWLVGWFTAGLRLRLDAATPRPRSRSGGLRPGLDACVAALPALWVLACGWLACMRAPPASGPSGLCAERERAPLLLRQSWRHTNGSSSAHQPSGPRGLGACSLLSSPHTGDLLPCCTGRPAWRTCCIDGSLPSMHPGAEHSTAQPLRAPATSRHLHTHLGRTG